MRPKTNSAKALLIAGGRILIVAIITLAGLSVTSNQASAQTWNLTKAQRQAYLNYYAPVILKRGDENNSKQGRDWITNYDFDQDGDFSNNRVNWLNIPNYVNASAVGPSAYDRWRIRPTLYTALIEYMEGGSKSLVLFYHVYNATDKDGEDIHDWERVEILVRGVTGTPGGGGEYVNHVAVTMHKEQLMRRYYDAGGLNFMQTATGKHILIWQADESDWDWATSDYGYHGHALRHVITPYSTIASQMNSTTAEAKVAVTQSDSKNVHYVFAPEGSQAAVDTWRAKPLSYTTASGLASRVDNGDTVRWYSTKRITYELQDVADIFPTHWQGNQWYVHWLTNDLRYVLLESPILNEAGQPEVSAGMQLFYLRSRDIGKSDGVGADAAVLAKNQIWGNYSAELNSEAPWDGDDFGGFEGLGIDSFGRSRGAASGYYNSHNSFWWQHDFFVHSGVITSDQTHHEAGTWLAGEWYTAANGGFDGRWVQLFDDRPGLEPSTPLSLSMTYPTNRCAEVFSVTARATGGQSPYTFTWTGATPTSSANDPTNTAYVYAYTQGTVTVQSADGQTRTASFRLTPQCTGGQQLP
ncbi:MAG TPA: hypothetical protein VE262_24040 [Blastocatellia bacterium]|nr:hypothetical protein [Blastocatellia bacterium]